MMMMMLVMMMMILLLTIIMMISMILMLYYFTNTDEYTMYTIICRLTINYINVIMRALCGLERAVCTHVRARAPAHTHTRLMVERTALQLLLVDCSRVRDWGLERGKGSKNTHTHTHACMHACMHAWHASCKR